MRGDGPRSRSSDISARLATSTDRKSISNTGTARAAPLAWCSFPAATQAASLLEARAHETDRKEDDPRETRGS